jgi:hypothetical protein
VNDFNNMIATLKVFRNPGQPINAKPQEGNIFNTAIPSGLDSGAVFNVAGGSDNPAPKKKTDDGMMMYLLIGGAIVAFIIIRRRRG